MKKIFLIMGFVTLLFLFSIQVKAINGAENQNTINQLWQQILLIKDKISNILQSQTASLSNATTDCFETDGGQNFFIKGTLSYNYLGQNKSLNDYCIDGFRLIEYYCYSGSAFKTEFRCENGCEDGKCKTEKGCVPNWQLEDYPCTNNKQLISYKDINNCGVLTNRPTDHGTIKDCFIKCSPNWQINEGAGWSSCVNGIQTMGWIDANNCNTTTGKPADETRSCQTSSTCTETDNGKDYSTKGSVFYAGSTTFDYCYNDLYLAEFYCENGIGKSEWKYCEQGCKDGACVKGFLCIPDWTPGEWSTCTNGTQKRSWIDKSNCNTTTGKPADETRGCQNIIEKITTSCSETGDNGRDFFTKGILTDALGRTLQEYCVGDSVFEYYCDGDSTKSEYYLCKNGCNNGACNPENQCTDTDGGIDYYNKGNIINSLGINYYDYCVSSGIETGKLVEYYCSNNQVGFEYYSCPNGCEDGKCRGSLTCSDTDGGKNYNIKGVCTHTNGMKSTDFCLSSNQLTEYYCDGGIIKSENKTCPYICNDGTCTSCSDTDGGKNYYLKGTLTRLDTGQILNDYCQNNNQLIEYYCDINSATHWSSEIKNCENGCLSGACITSCVPDWKAGEWSVCSGNPPVQTRSYTDTNNCGTTNNKPADETRSCQIISSCTDTDGGKDYFTRGNALRGDGGTTYTDFCSSNNSSLTEYYCDNEIIKSESISCENGCNNGACIKAPTTCSETDSGRDYFNKGTLSYNSLTYNDYCFYNNSKWLVEYYCENGIGKSEYKICEQGCNNGACITSCVPDWKAGEWSVCSGNPPVQTRSYTDTNNCGTTNNKPADETRSCQIISSCTDTDGGKDYFTRGTTSNNFSNETDYCTGLNYGRELIEYYCDGNTIKSEKINCENGCDSNNGRCHRAQCTDSDGGKIYNVRGETSDINGSQIDYCSGNYLIEYFCNGNYKNYEYYYCSNGCLSGACITSCVPDWKAGEWSVCSGNPPVQTRSYTDTNNCGTTNNKPADETRSCQIISSCTDTDGGKDYNVRGDMNVFANFQNVKYTDYCSNEYNGWLLEYYCDGFTGRAEWKNCEYGCENGRCKDSFTQQGCTDSDGGKSYFTKGYITYSGNTMYDSCYDENRLLEKFCTTGLDDGETKTCQYGCFDGACKRGINLTHPIVITQNNTDIQTGKSYEIRWNSEGYDGKNILIKLVEFDVYNQQLGSFNINTFYWGSGISNYIPWNIPSTTKPGAYKIVFVNPANENDIYYYSNLFRIITTTNQQCNDTDGGQNYGVRGNISYYNASGLLEIKTDSCDGNILTEYYCQEGYNYKTEYYTCPNGCENGSCKISINKKTCIDSDGGINYNQKGNIEGVENGNQKKYTDFCSGNYLGEYYCDTNLNIQFLSYICPNGCYFGSCK